MKRKRIDFLSIDRNYGAAFGTAAPLWCVPALIPEKLRARMSSR
jgi:hypothetical protein